ncbi:MAG: LysR family transcriptional regulator [Gammaproteobacteria bacterium]|nr:LysR family transcriptional regulator [Gammaproteobacteria bacterium]
MDKLNSIRVFLQVARLGGFSSAAQHLGISKAMVSKHVSDLERQLGVRLINRTTRHLKLTESGILYRDRVQGILEDLEATEVSVANLNAAPSGTLRLMAPTSFGSFHLTRAIAEYRQKYPKVGIDMVFTGRTLDFVGEGLDLAIRTGELKDSTQVARRLTHSRLVVSASPAYLKKYGVPLVPIDLTRHNCLIYSPRSPLGAWPFTVDGKATTVRVHGDVKANTADALRIASIHGCGLTQLPTYVVGLDIKAGRLQPVLENFEPPMQPIYAVYLHRQNLTAKVSTFVDFLYDYYQPIPYWEQWTDA